MPGFGVYVCFVDLELAEQLSKNSATGLMRGLISRWYTRERLAGCSATFVINQTIRTAVFSKTELVQLLDFLSKNQRGLQSQVYMFQTLQFNYYVHQTFLSQNITRRGTALVSIN